MTCWRELCTLGVIGIALGLLLACRLDLVAGVTLIAIAAIGSLVVTSRNAYVKNARASVALQASERRRSGGAL